MKRARTVLAVASGGGHWIQLLRLRPAFAGHRVHFVTTLSGLQIEADDSDVTIVRDASRSDKLSLVILLLQLFWLMLKFRPSTVVTTGAAPGLLALRLGKMMGARTVWIDSAANVEELSLSGVLARKHADLWLTQWPHLAAKYEGLQFRGAIL